jgi:hypothetical protein
VLAMAHSTLENMKTGSEPASSGGRSSEDGRPSVCADSLLGSARVRRNPLRSARNTPDVRQRATTDSSACPSARGGCGALQATARPLPLDQLATELGVHARTLQPAARSGRLAAHFSVRSVFGRPIRRASRAASGSGSPDLGAAGRREGGARDGRALARSGQTAMLGVASSSPAVFVTFASVFAGTALLAGYLPARRAASTDPMIALRAE